jgi:hypothetical protein
MSQPDIFLKEASEHHKYRLLGDAHNFRAIPSIVVYLIPLILFIVIMGFISQIPTSKKIDFTMISHKDNMVMFIAKNKIILEQDITVLVNGTAVNNKINQCTQPPLQVNCYYIENTSGIKARFQDMSIIIHSNLLDEIF